MLFLADTLRDGFFMCKRLDEVLGNAGFADFSGGRS